MSENTGNPETSFGTGYFFLGLVGVYLLLMGLLKQDNILRIAVFGPLITAAMGVFLVMLSVDWRHGLSSSLQSATSAFFHRLSLKESSRLLNVFIVFLTFNLVWLSAFFLPRNAPSMFGITLLFAAGLSPLLAGKFLSSSSNLIPTNVADAERTEEFERISNALLSNDGHRLIKRQKLMLLDQQERFRAHLRELSSDSTSWSKLLGRLESAAKRDPESLRSQLLDSFSSEAMPYFSYFLKNNSGLGENERYLIEANFLTESLAELLLKVASEKRRDARLQWSLGWVLSRYLFSLQDTTLLNIDRGAISSHKIWDHEPILYAQVLELMSNADSRNWDPWFLCMYQKRVTKMLSELTGKQASDIMKAGRALEPDPIVLAWQSCILDMLLNTPESSSTQRKHSLSSSIYASLDGWPELAEQNVDPAAFKAIAAPVFSGLSLKQMTFTQQLLMLMLVLSFQR